jgi:TIR domain
MGRMGVEAMDEIKIFVSHSSKYAEIAKSLKLSLQALESKTLLDIRLSEEMAGATDWRRWIEDNVRTADIFLLLFPHAKVDMGWCNYELGRFYDDKRKVACIKNTDIPKPPPAFEPYQAYDADADGFRKFIDELFVKGTFTDGRPLNSSIGQLTDKLYERAQAVSQELAGKFAQARVREQLYERRILLSVRYDAKGRFDPQASTVQGNGDGLQLLGLGQVTSIPWSKVRQGIGEGVDWPAELERALPSITSGSLPPALPPFFASTDIYIPVITRAESVDGVLGEIALIFVAVNTDRLRPLIDWTLPKGMPDAFAVLVRLVRMMFRARWDILEPRYQEARYQAPAPARCAELARAVIADYQKMQRDSETQGIQGLDKFYAVFSRELRTDVEACGDEWTRLMGALAEAPPDNSKALSGALKDLRDNNSRWLQLAAKQFVVFAGDLR